MMLLAGLEVRELSRTAKMRAAAGGLALAALLLAACLPGAQQQPPPTAAPAQPQPAAPQPAPPLATPGPTPLPQQAEPPASTPAEPSPAPSPAFQGTRGPVVAQQPPAPPVAQLVDVRLGRHQGFDRVVFEFTGNLPGYQVAYVQPPIREDGSGFTLEVQGQAFLEARFEPATGWDFDRGEPSYPGPRRIQGGFPNLREAVRSGDFEAILTWALGLERESDFRVIELSEPLRVVIDVAH